jgi:DNA-directed RNA polymerase specialized sigma24 family protein
MLTPASTTKNNKKYNRSGGPVNEVPALSPDLEWMLQSSQASDERIVTALAAEYYPSLYRLALAVFNDRAVARQVANESLAVAPLNAHRYSHETSVQTWIYGLALEVCQSRIWTISQPNSQEQRNLSDRQLSACNPILPIDLEGRAWQAVDALEPLYRLPLILHSVLELPTGEIAQTLRVKEKAIVKRLKFAYQNILGFLDQSVPTGYKPNQDEIEFWLRSFLQQRWPLTDFPASEIEKLHSEALSQVQMKRAARRRLVRLEEILLIGLAIIVVLALLNAVNVLGAGQENRSLSTPTVPRRPPIQERSSTIPNGLGFTLPEARPRQSLAREVWTRRLTSLPGVSSGLGFYWTGTVAGRLIDPLVSASSPACG